MRRVWRWLLFATHLRPTYWRLRVEPVAVCPCGCGSGTDGLTVRIRGRWWATAEDVAAARAEAVSSHIRPLRRRGYKVEFATVEG